MLKRPEHMYRPDSGRSDTGQSSSSVQCLDALIPARAPLPSRATKRPELDALLKVQRIGNYTVDCTLKFYGLQTA